MFSDETSTFPISLYQKWSTARWYLKSTCLDSSVKRSFWTSARKSWLSPAITASNIAFTDPGCMKRSKSLFNFCNHCVPPTWNESAENLIFIELWATMDRCLDCQYIAPPECVSTALVIDIRDGCLLFQFASLYPQILSSLSALNKISILYVALRYLSASFTASARFLVGLDMQRERRPTANAISALAVLPILQIRNA